MDMFLALYGLWTILISMSIQTPNFRSALIFKLIPFVSGAILLFNQLKLMGYI